jgi:hypothetical protein
MTKVKKTKKPKARKAVKKPVAKVRKIDPRLKPSPKPKIIKIDTRINKPLKIIDIPRPPQQPLRMFSGQDTGAIFNKQLDVLASKEQQLEGKVLTLQQELQKEKNEKKDLEILTEIQDIGQRIENYKNNIGNEDINYLKTRINELLKNKTLESTYYDILIDQKVYLKDIVKENIKDYFEEKKETNTLLDDTIVQNNLIDEVKETKKKSRRKKTDTKLDDEIYENNLVDKQLVVESYLNNPDPLKEIFERAEARGLLND